MGPNKNGMRSISAASRPEWTHRAGGLDSRAENSLADIESTKVWENSNIVTSSWLDRLLLAQCITRIMPVVIRMSHRQRHQRTVKSSYENSACYEILPVWKKNIGEIFDLASNWAKYALILQEKPHEFTRIDMIPSILLFPTHFILHELGENFAYDPQFKGPKQERSSTDTVFMIIFTVVIVLWMAMGFWGKHSSRTNSIRAAQITSQIPVVSVYRQSSHNHWRSISFPAIGTSDFIKRVSSDTSKATVSWYCARCKWE